MHDSHDGIGVVHDANPGAEGRIGEAVTEAGDGVDDDEGWERWMSGQYSVGGEMTEGGGDADAALAELCVDPGVEDRGGGVTGEGCQKDERDNRVVEAVVFLEGRDESLWWMSVLRHLSIGH